MADWLDLTTRQAQLHYEQFDDALSCVALLREVLQPVEMQRFARFDIVHGDTHMACEGAADPADFAVKLLLVR